MEYLDIVDEQGQPTGEIISRTLAHTEGIRHRTAHIWIVRRENEHFQVLMQKRAMSKDSFPGKYDTSSAGHIQAGDEPLGHPACGSLRKSWASTPNRRILHLPDAFTEILQKNFTEKSSGTTKLPLSMSISSLSISRHSSCKRGGGTVRWFDLEETYQNCQNRNTQFCAPVPGLEVVRRYLYS